MKLIPRSMQLTFLTRKNRLGSCRFALTPLPTASGKVINPEPVSTWSFVESNAHILSTNCPARKLGGGVIFIAGLSSVYISCIELADTR